MYYCTRDYCTGVREIKLYYWYDSVNQNIREIPPAKMRNALFSGTRVSIEIFKNGR